MKSCASEKMTKDKINAGLHALHWYDSQHDWWTAAIRPSLVQIEPRYQRYFDMKHSKVLGSVNHKQMQYVYCSYRDEQLWVPEGQHRLQLAISEGIELLNVVMLFNKTIKEEAEFFWHGNEHRKAVNPLGTFRAAIEAGDLASVTIHAKITECDWTIAPDSKGAKAYDVTTIVPYRDAYAAGVLDQFLNTLKAYTTDEGRIHKDVKRSASEFYKGVISLARIYPTATNTPGYTSKLRDIGYDAIKQVANEITASCNRCRALSGDYKQAMVQCLLGHKFDIVQIEKSITA